MRTRRHRQLSLRRGDATRWSNLQAWILTGAGTLVLAGMMITALVRHERLLEEERSGWPFTVPWDPSWPSLPIVSGPGSLALDVAQSVYALAATNAETLQYIPCYCGCRSQGHQSVSQCYVKRRSPDGGVTEWDGHGRICPLGADITGDVTARHQHGTPLSKIRAQIDEEFSARGPATPTPPVPRH